MQNVQRNKADGSNALTATDNRGGKPTGGSGEVSGSGAGAGGSGAPEDYDSDSAGGGGTFPPAGPKEGGTGADAPSHGSR
jgi:hypothetical protein